MELPLSLTESPRRIGARRCRKTGIAAADCLIDHPDAVDRAGSPTVASDPPELIGAELALGALAAVHDEVVVAREVDAPALCFVRKPDAGRESPTKGCLFRANLRHTDARGAVPVPSSLPKPRLCRCVRIPYEPLPAARRRR